MLTKRNYTVNVETSKDTVTITATKGEITVMIETFEHTVELPKKMNVIKRKSVTVTEQAICFKCKNDRFSQMLNNWVKKETRPLGYIINVAERMSRVFEILK